MSGLQTWEKAKHALHILGLGAGRQSSVMYLMAVAGEIEPIPDYAIFADTGNEPAHVYRQLEYLESIGGRVVPIVKVSSGNIYDDTLAAIAGGAPWGERRWLGPPGFADGGGPIRRKCTQYYKVEPKERKARELMKLHGKLTIVDWRGHTLDEIERAKPDRRRYYFVRWPLLEKRMSDHACAEWLRRNGHPEFYWSACEICPFRLRDIRTVKALKADVDAWERINRVDNGIRDMSRFGVERAVFLNDRYMPMVEFEEMQPLEKQPSLFDCDGGACGL